MKLPSPGQLRVLVFIGRFITEHGYPPTLREMGQNCGFKSTNAGVDFLDGLEKKGLIVRRGGLGSSRALRITTEGERYLDSPLPKRIGPRPVDLAFGAERAVEALDLCA